MTMNKLVASLSNKLGYEKGQYQQLFQSS